MKKLMILAALTLGAQFASAGSIENSELESRHQLVIEQAIAKSCGLSGRLKQVKNEVEEIRIDQGITDRVYTTDVEVVVGVDQYLTDTFVVRVVSEYADMYDHEMKDWGAYSVSKVSSSDVVCK